MKKLIIIVCSLLMAATLAHGIVSTSYTNTSETAVTMCDLDYVRVTY